MIRFDREKNKRPIVSVSKIYRDSAPLKREEASLIEGLEIKFGKQANYQICFRVGSGKFSDAFLGYDVERNKKIIIKNLLPTQYSNICKEIRMLSYLKDVPNVVKLLDVTKNERTKSIALIFEWIGNQQTSKVFAKLSIKEVKFYMYKLIKTIDIIHSKGVFHRDIKPQNIVINPKLRKINIIDWGQSTFYVPKAAYPVRVSTRGYKAPELSLGFPYYDYSVDIWCFGCLIGAILLGIEVLFPGVTNEDSFAKVVVLLGRQDLDKYLDKYKIPVSDAVYEAIKNINGERKDFSKLKNTQNLPLSPEAIDLLERIFQYDHQKRITANEITKHPFFDEIQGYL